MGKFVLLFVAAVAIGGAVQGVGRLSRDASAADDAGRDRQSVVAERHARTALAAAASQVRRSFDTWRVGLPATRFAGGAFEATAEGPAAGPVRIRATGALGASGHRAEAVLARFPDLADGAVLIDADTAIVTLSGSAWLLSGDDSRAESWLSAAAPAEGTGFGSDVHAVWTRTAGLDRAFTTALGSNGARARGSAGTADVASGDIPDLTPVLREAEANATDVFAGSQTFSTARTFGTASAPRIVRISGNATFNSTVRGYGLLLVEGSLDARSSFEWHGLVVARSRGTMNVTLGGNARVYGGLYVLHEAGYSLGTSFFPLRTLWAVDDRTGALRYYPLRGAATQGSTEGTLSGLLEGLVPGTTDPSDVEALAFAPNGTMYFVNNVDGRGNRLYRVLPAQFDGRASTPVVATPVGATGRTGADEVAGLVYHYGNLYGISRSSRRIYLMNTTTGAASDVRTFSAGSGTYQVAGLTRGPDGAVYTARQSGTTTQVWRFAEFPTSDPVLVSTVPGVAQALAGHPRSQLYTHDGTGTLRELNTPSGALRTSLSLATTSEAASFYASGEDGGTETMVPPLLTLPRYDGTTTQTYAVPWDGGPDLTATVTRSLPSGSWCSTPFVYGSTLAAMAADADLNGRTPVGSAVRTEYTGPTPLPILRFSPGAGCSATATTQIRLRFSQAWTGPFSLYLIDQDKNPVHFAAYNAAGTAVSTSGWRMTADLDVVGAVNTPAQVFEPAGTWTGSGYPSGAARLRRASACPDGDCEMSLTEIRVDNYAAIRDIVIYTSSPEDWPDYMAVTVSSQALFATGTALNVTMRDNAAVLFSAESMGKLAALLPTVRDRSTIATYDEYERDLPAADRRLGRLWDTWAVSPPDAPISQGR